MSDTQSPTPSPARGTLPEIEPDSAFFWTAGADGVLRIQRCGDCATWQHPPLPRCAACGSEAVAPADTSGKGRVASYTVNHEKWLPAMDVPFVFAAIELDEQDQLYVFSNIEAPIDAVRRGMAVEVYFAQAEDVWLPLFRPSGETA